MRIAEDLRLNKKSIEYGEHTDHTRNDYNFDLFREQQEFVRISARLGTDPDTGRLGIHSVYFAPCVSLIPVFTNGQISWPSPLYFQNSAEDLAVNITSKKARKSYS